MQWNIGAIPVASVLILAAAGLWFGRFKLLAISERSQVVTVPSFVKRHYSKITVAYIVWFLALAGFALFGDFD